LDDARRRLRIGRRGRFAALTRRNVSHLI
jgi:hypothetical protein